MASGEDPGAKSLSPEHHTSEGQTGLCGNSLSCRALEEMGSCFFFQLSHWLNLDFLLGHALVLNRAGNAQFLRRKEGYCQKIKRCSQWDPWDHTHIINALNLVWFSGLYLVASELSLLAWKTFWHKETAFLISCDIFHLQQQMFTELQKISEL